MSLFGGVSESAVYDGDKTIMGTVVEQGDVSIIGNLSLTALATPGAPAITDVGTPGNTTRAYKVVAKCGSGVTAASAAGQTTTGNATLSSTNYQTITWTRVAGATGYDIYRTTANGSPATTGKIGSVTGGGTLTFNDTGLAGDSTTPPTANTTGAITHGGVIAAATTLNRLVHKKTGIANNSATAVLTVTVPNANHAAVIRLMFLSSNGSTDAFESSRTAQGSVVIARTTNAATVAVATALTAADIATVAAGATHTLAYGVSSISGAVGETQTFTITVTINDSGNLGANQVVLVAELLNSEASGVTIAPA